MAGNRCAVQSVQRRMGHTSRRRTLLLVPVLAVTLAACGDDSPPAAAPEATETLPPVTAADAPAHVYATGPDDVVIAVEYEGGFAPQEMLFARTPVAMVTGDGRALTTGPVPAIYPGPMLPNVLERSITPEATQTLLARADELGLLAKVDYARNDQIADAADTVVTITADGSTYRHQAYALGMDVEQDPARANLAEFVTAMLDLPATVGADQLGPEGAFAGEQYLIQAEPFDPLTLSVDVEPTIVPWPADAPVRLADAGECAAVPVAQFESLFAEATTLTFFTDAGETYLVSVVPQYPGRTC
jgi:hypothetical protein